MKTLFRATLLFITSIPLFGANEWLYYKHFPWVYDHQSKEWIYLNGSADGKIYAWRQSTKEWHIFSVEDIPTETSDEQTTNKAPINLDHVGNLAVVEEQVSGTIVGNFQAYDPDGDSLTYELATGEGDGNNAMFTLESNGTLRTAMQFEYQAYRRLSIRVKATDTNNLSVEKAFTALVLDTPETPDTSLSSNLQLQLHESVVMDFILVQPGTFTMGEVGVAEPVHQVKLTKPFYLGKYEVTGSQESAVMYYPNYVHNSASKYINIPSAGRSYNYVEDYLVKLNEQQQANLPDGWEFVLPSEAQWEYACRAGTTTSFYTGNTITKNDGNWDAGVGVNAVDVGQYPPNNWGFYDMHGNLSEWTRTWYHNYTNTFKIDPEPEILNDFRQKHTRGGSWKSHAAWLVRSALRTHQPMWAEDSNLGYRIAIQQK